MSITRLHMLAYEAEDLIKSRKKQTIYVSEGTIEVFVKQKLCKGFV